MAKFFIMETFHCTRLYQPDTDGGTQDIQPSEMELLIEKGMTHHLQPADDDAKDMMPSIEEMTRGDLRALADPKGIDYTGMSLEQLRAAVTASQPDQKQEKKALATMTLAELQLLAVDKGVESSGLNKKKLIEALQATE